LAHRDFSFLYLDILHLEDIHDLVLNELFFQEDVQEEPTLAGISLAHL
jgi:hypothetical protein